MQVLEEETLPVFDHGHRGDLAGQPGSPDVSLGRLDRELLAGQPVLQLGRVELTDHLSLRNPDAVGLDGDDGDATLNRVVHDDAPAPGRPAHVSVLGPGKCTRQEGPTAH